jgi:AAA ATPase domain
MRAFLDVAAASDDHRRTRADPSAPSLVGRHRELQLVGDTVARGRESGAALVVMGEAGIGKSAVLDEASRLAAERGGRTLTTVGAETEGAMAYAGLHQLLRPALGDVDRLPAHQRDALLTAFGEVDGAAADVFIVALAALNLLSETATLAPLLLVADDAQWLDRSTQQVLAFVGRRLENEPIVLLCAIRTGCDSVLGGAGLPELHLAPLSDDAAREPLDTRSPHLSPPMRARVLQEAAGCPLALTELPIALAAQPTSGPVPPPWLPMTARLERTFASRASELPPASRTLLLLAALNDSELQSETLAAASLVHGGPVTVDDATPARDLRMVNLDESTLRFRHPLMRSAIRQEASIARRHEAHAALAEALTDPDRLAAHATDMAAGGDADLALKLLWGAALRCFWGEPGPEIRQRVVDAAEGVQVAEDDPPLLVVVATAAPIDRAAVVTRRLRALATPLLDASPASTFLLGHAALMVGALDEAERFVASSLEDLRTQGRLGIVARALLAQTWCAIQLGDLGVAIPAAAEAARLATETSQPLVHACARAEEAVLAALRGDEGESEKLAAEAEQFAVPAAANAVLAIVQIARGWAALADGRHADAFSQLGRVFDPTDPAHHLGFRAAVVSQMTEAAVFTGQGDAARDLVEGITQLAGEIPSPWLEADSLYSRALLADDNAAEAAFQAALGADMRRSPFVRCRTLLAYGAWLRRHRRPGDARAPIRSARETFDALGAVPWGERAAKSYEPPASRAPDRRPRPATS